MGENSYLTMNQNETVHHKTSALGWVGLTIEGWGEKCESRIELQGQESCY